MARETKVGLLAGLAFIICFAVILANRGREESLSNRTLPFQSAIPASNPGLDGQGGAVFGPKSSGTRVALPYPANPNLGGERRPASVEQSGVQPAVERSNGHEVVAQRDAANPRHTLPARVDLQPAILENTVPLTSQRPPQDAASRQVMEQTLDDLAAKVGAPARTPNGAIPLAPPSGSKPLEVAPPPKKKYTVTAGDTLSKIALAHYGSPSTGLVNSLFEANRSVLDKPDVLPAGAELVIPEVAPSTSTAPKPAEAVNGKTDSKSKPNGRGSEAAKPKEKEKEKIAQNSTMEAGRWYQVRKNDRYYSIARDQLGDGARWKEIHDLNKDKFPDPAMIREGVRIRLPQAMADAKNRRR